MKIDETHAADRTSWVGSANGHAMFPIQNLPLGVFSPEGGPARGGVAIGDSIFDIGAALEAGPVPRRGPRCGGGGQRAHAESAAAGGGGARVRHCGDGSAKSSTQPEPRRQKSRPSPAGCCMTPDVASVHLPARIGNFTDFFAGIHHAHTAGTISRPENPLMPNYKYVPVAYHSRASSVRPSGGTVRRPNGQRKPPEQAAPDFGPCRNLDYELELGVWIGPGNELGTPIPIAEASRHIAGYCLLNDWSAGISRHGNRSRWGRFWPRACPRSFRPGSLRRKPGAVPHRPAGAAGRRSGAAAASE